MRLRALVSAVVVFLAFAAVASAEKGREAASSVPAPSVQGSAVPSVEPALPDFSVPALANLSCTATLDCEDGNVITCSGNSNCSSNHFYGYVECDGQRTTCPNFCTASLTHDCGLCGTYFCYCTSLSGDCVEGTNSVTCNGFEHFCRCPFGC